MKHYFCDAAAFELLEEFLKRVQFTNGIEFCSKHQLEKAQEAISAELQIRERIKNEKACEGWAKGKLLTSGE